MVKILIGLGVGLSALLVGCGAKEINIEDDFSGDTLTIKSINQTYNSNCIVEDIYVTTDNYDTSEAQLVELLSVTNKFKNIEDEKNTFTKVIVEDIEGNELGLIMEMGNNLEKRLKSKGNNTTDFRLNYSEEDEKKLSIKIEDLKKDSSISKNISDYTNQNYNHTDNWNNMNEIIDKDLIYTFEEKFNKEYYKKAGNDKEWNDYAELTQDDKLELLNKSSKALISMYALHTESLTEDEIAYLEELAECLFTIKLSEEYNETISCNIHES